MPTSSIYPALQSIEYYKHSSLKAWSKRLVDALRSMGWTAFKWEPNIWMQVRKIGNHYQYLAVYVDDLAFAVDDPEDLIATLKNPKKFNFKLKGSGVILFHLGI